MNLICQGLQTVFNIKHIRKGGADDGNAFRRVGNQDLYSYTYRTIRIEALKLAGTVKK